MVPSELVTSFRIWGKTEAFSRDRRARAMDTPDLHLPNLSRLAESFGMKPMVGGNRASLITAKAECSRAEIELILY